VPDAKDREESQADLLGNGEVRIRCYQIEDAGELLTAVAGVPPKVEALGSPYMCGAAEVASVAIGVSHCFLPNGLSNFSIPGWTMPLSASARMAALKFISPRVTLHGCTE
jgi:hypothetical protein